MSTERSWHQHAEITEGYNNGTKTQGKVKVWVPLENVRKIQRSIMHGDTILCKTYGRIPREIVSLRDIRLSVESAIQDYARECNSKVQLYEAYEPRGQIYKQGDLDKADKADMPVRDIEKDAHINQIREILDRVYH